MSSSYDVRFDPVALEALGETAAYIESEFGPIRAGRWLEAMRLGIQKLESTPGAFPVACMRRGRTIHSKLVQGHRVYYFIDTLKGIVYIIDVVHTARETRLAQYRDPD